MHLASFSLRGLVLASSLVVAISSAAFAIGDESDETKPPPKTETTTKCADGKVWDAKRKECVVPKKNSFNDDDLYKAAREFAYAGQYDSALTVLQLAKNQNDPRILNYLGYANRKAGRMELGMSYYRKACRPTRIIFWHGHIWDKLWWNRVTCRERVSNSSRFGIEAASRPGPIARCCRR